MTSLHLTVQRWLTKVVARVNGVPANGALINTVGNGSGLELSAARPISRLAVGDTDAEISALQQTQTQVMDSRSTTLWVKSGSTWSGALYAGTGALLRPSTLCASLPNRRIYYCDAFMRLTQVRLTTDPTPT